MRMRGYRGCYLPGVSSSPTDLVSLVLGDEGVLTAIDRSAARDLVDCEGFAVIPKVVDQHLHGFDSVDFTEASNETSSKQLAREGVGGYCVSTRAVHPQGLVAWLSQPLGATPTDGARAIGVHIEGTFLVKDRCGAHDPRYALGADTSFLRRLVGSSARRISQLTLSPEADGAPGFVQAAVSMGVRVALGHTDASYDRVLEVVDAGASAVTHIMNAMRPISAREPGLLGAAKTRGLFVEVNPNPGMVHPIVLSMLAELVSPDRLIFVSDCVAATTFPSQQSNGLVFERHGVLTGGSVLLPALLPRLKTVLGASLARLVQATYSNPLAFLEEREGWPPRLGERPQLMLLDAEWQHRPLPPLRVATVTS